MRSSVFFTLDIKARNTSKDLEPCGRVATNLDLRLSRAKGIERLVEQVADDSGLWLVARGANVVDREIVVDPHMALDETGHLPLLAGAIEALQDENVTAAGRPTVAFTVARLVRVSQRCADRLAERSGVRGLGGADTVSQTSFFHGTPSRTA